MLEILVKKLVGFRLERFRFGMSRVQVRTEKDSR